MITINPHDCTITPEKGALPCTVTVRFDARSSMAGGEDVVVVYDVGDGTPVTIDGASNPRTMLEVPRHIGSGSTKVSEDLVLRKASGKSPCGDLTIDVLVTRSGRVQDRVSGVFRITC